MLRAHIFYALSAFSLATFGLFSAGESTLPITTCKRDSADYSACLKHFLEEAWPRLSAGLPEFDFPSLDPLLFKYGKIVYNSNLVRANVTVSNTTATGLSKIRFYDIRANLVDDVFRLEIDVRTPRISLEGAMKMNGTLGVFRIVDNGRFNITGYDVRGTWDLTGHVVNDTWIVEQFRLLPSVKKIQAYLDYLFEGNKELNDLATLFINEYWPPLYREMLPTASNVWGPWLVGLVNNIFSKVPFSKLFP